MSSSYPNDKSNTPPEYVVTAWQQSVEVQKHFNELQLKLRSFMITLLVAVLGAAALAVKESATVDILGFSTSVSFLAILAGMTATTAFYFLDLGYHKLLVGAVKHGMKIESDYNMFPALALAHSIKDTSNFKILFFDIDSHKRLHFLYLGLLLSQLIVGIFGQLASSSGQDAVSERTRTTQVNISLGDLVSETNSLVRTPGAK